MRAAPRPPIRSDRAAPGASSTVTSCSRGAARPDHVARPADDDARQVARGHRCHRLQLGGIDHAQDRIRRRGLDHVAGVVPALGDDAGESGAVTTARPASAAAAPASLSALRQRRLRRPPGRAALLRARACAATPRSTRPAMRVTAARVLSTRARACMTSARLRGHVRRERRDVEAHQHVADARRDRLRPLAVPRCARAPAR